jgi:hypothetical protein
LLLVTTWSGLRREKHKLRCWRWRGTEKDEEIAVFIETKTQRVFVRDPWH